MDQLPSRTYLFGDPDSAARSGATSRASCLSLFGPVSAIGAKALLHRKLVRIVEFHDGCSQHVRSNRVWRVQRDGGNNEHRCARSFLWLYRATLRSSQRRIRALCKGTENVRQYQAADNNILLTTNDFSQPWGTESPLQQTV